MPGGRVADELQKLIADLCAKYRTPKFQPHITLIGELDLPETTVATRTRELAGEIEPFKIKLDEVTYLDEYFRCLFIKVQKSRSLMDANSAARALFDTEETEEYMPHLSLVYGDLTRQMKQNIIRAIGGKIDVAFLVEEIHLYYTGGQPRDWHCVLQMPCGQRNL
jgi:2'-5' RNA ligase